MKLIVGFLFFCSFQLFSQSYLNILLFNDSYKNSQISELKKITFSENGEVIYFNLTNGTTLSENTANIKRFVFGNTPLGNPLPVELSAFNAIQIGSSVVLKWRTESEVNNYGFEVERATQIINSKNDWSKIGIIAGNGNSNSPKDYSYIDNPAKGNKYFYRLKQIDNDGQYEYSSIVNIDLNIPNKFALEQNYPNPFNPTTNIKYNIPFDTNVQLKIYDVLGRELSILVNEFQKAGAYSIPFNAEELSSGIYICKITTNNFNSSIKMILMK